MFSRKQHQREQHQKSLNSFFFSSISNNMKKKVYNCLNIKTEYQITIGQMLNNQV